MARLAPGARITDVRIFGTQLSLVGGEDASYAEEIAAFVDGRMNAIAAAQNVSDPGKVAILAALDIASEIIRLREARSRRGNNAGRAADRLGRCVDAGHHEPGS